jgi:catechol 2,3-dioxygenase-like lactoylglutathione lyase family enzyme
MRLHHVSIPFTAERLDDGRRFYSEVFDLRQIPTPQTLDVDQVIWFALGDRELHLFTEEVANATASRRHFCFDVDDLDAAPARLVEHDAHIEEALPIHNRPRFYAFDPAGNKLELTQIVGDYTAVSAS